MYSALSVAKFFINQGILEGKPVTNMKLQKLVYFAHGWYLACHDEALIDEYIEAWQYGPVVPSLYHAFSFLGNKPIDDVTQLGTLTLGASPNGAQERHSIQAQDHAFLANVWESLKSFSARELSALTHLKGTPWDQTQQNATGLRGVNISNDLIQMYFASLAPEDAQAA